MPAYFAPDVTCTGPARDIPAFAFLRAGSKWFSAASSQNGKRGTVVWIGDAEDQPKPGESGWYECSNGLWYLPGLKMPSQFDLLRGHRIDGIDYTTSVGVTITIPIAAAAPRKLLFSKREAGEPSEEFAKRAFLLFDRLINGEKVSALDPDIISLVADAVGHVYYVTPEILQELGWITTADLDPIICCLMGSDPKKAQPADGKSPSAAVA